MYDNKKAKCIEYSKSNIPEIDLTSINNKNCNNTNIKKKLIKENKKEGIYIIYN